MRGLAIFAILPLLSSAAPPAPRDVTVTGLQFGDIVYGGSGCPQGSINATITPSGTILPLRFGDEFEASIGPKVPFTESRKNCQLNIDLKYSPGFQFSVLSTDYKGFVDLEAGIEGKVKSTYYFSGETDQVSTQVTFTGPITAAYTKHDEEAIATWSPCGKEAMININTEVVLGDPANGGGNGLLTVDKGSGKFTHLVYLRWRQC